MFSQPTPTLQTQQFTRGYDDPCSRAARDRETMGPGAYQREFLVPDNRVATSTAFQQPAVPAAAGFGWSRQSIDVDSILRNHGMQTNSPHCPVRGQARPFATVPFMGRGRGDADAESQLKMPDFQRQGKNCGTISDTFYENQFTPQIAFVSQSIQNPKHLIPEDASRGWVHGGIPSRQWGRDQEC